MKFKILKLVLGIRRQDHDLYQGKMIMIKLIMIIDKDRSKITIIFQITLTKHIKYRLILTFYGLLYRLEYLEQYLVGNGLLLTSILEGFKAIKAKNRI